MVEYHEVDKKSQCVDSEKETDQLIFDENKTVVNREEGNFGHDRKGSNCSGSLRTCFLAFVILGIMGSLMYIFGRPPDVGDGMSDQEKSKFRMHTNGVDDLLTENVTSNSNSINQKVGNKIGSETKPESESKEVDNDKHEGTDTVTKVEITDSKQGEQGAEKIKVEKKDVNTGENPEYPIAEDVILQTDRNYGLHQGSQRAVFGPFLFDDPAVITSFTPIIDGTAVHHLIVYVSNYGLKNSKKWGQASRCCRGEDIIYSWSKSDEKINDTENRFPAMFKVHEGSGFILGKDKETGISTFGALYMEFHFEVSNALVTGLAIPALKTTQFRHGIRFREESGVVSAYSDKIKLSPLGVGISYVSRISLTGNQKDVSVCALCQITEDIDVYAFRNHAHSAARVIESQVYRNGIELGTLASRSARKPQRFIPLTNTASLKKGDFVFVTCHYDTSGRSFITSMGLSPTKQEMCNQYFMYAPRRLSPWGVCRNSCEAPRGKQYFEKAITFAKGNTGSAVFSLPYGGLGQVSGVAVNAEGSQLFILCRRKNIFNSRNVIEEETIFVLQSSRDDEMTPLNSFGAGLFVSPHGIYLDPLGGLWVTDTGLHQVFKLNSTTGQVMLVLGEKRLPGSGARRFNKPTDVVVSLSNGEKNVFVSDGYGNSRVAVFSYEGEFLREWGTRGRDKGQFNIPHNIDIGKYGHLYVADRENGRTQIFHKNGTYVGQWKGEFEQGSRPYYSSHLSALCYSSTLELMFLIEGTIIRARNSNGDSVMEWKANKDVWAHDIAIARDSRSNLNVYVAELDGKTVSRYTLGYK